MYSVKTDHCAYMYSHPPKSPFLSMKNPVNINKAQAAVFKHNKMQLFNSNTVASDTGKGQRQRKLMKSTF